MARVSTYLNFPGNTEEAFEFYKSVFGTEYETEIMRMGAVPESPDRPPLADTEKNLVMHVALPTIAGHAIMGTDVVPSMGFSFEQGNNVSINLEPDTRAEADKLFKGLSDGAKIEMDLQEAFWGDYYGSLIDKYGIRWMVNCRTKN